MLYGHTNSLMEKQEADKDTSKQGADIYVTLARQSALAVGKIGQNSPQSILQHELSCNQLCKQV
jgi:hypothetical protein